MHRLQLSFLSQSNFLSNCISKPRVHTNEQSTPVKCGRTVFLSSFVYSTSFTQRLSECLSAVYVHIFFSRANLCYDQPSPWKRGDFGVKHKNRCTRQKKYINGDEERKCIDFSPLPRREEKGGERLVFDSSRSSFFVSLCLSELRIYLRDQLERRRKRLPL